MLHSQSMEEENILSRMSAETSGSLFEAFFKSIRLFYTLLENCKHSYTITGVIEQSIDDSVLLKLLVLLALKPQSIFQRINYDILLSHHNEFYKILGKVFRKFAPSDYFQRFVGIVREIFGWDGEKPLVLSLLLEEELFDIELEVYLMGQSEINHVLSSSDMSAEGSRWVEKELSSVMEFVDLQEDPRSRRDPQLSR